MGKDFDIHELSKCIQTADVAATSTVPAHTTCAESNTTKVSKAKAIIELTIEDHVSKCETALTMWETLHSLYEDTGLTRKIGLLRSLIQCRLDECSSMQDFIDKIKSTSNKLVGIGFDISDEWIGAILLAGLSEDFKPMIMSVEASGQQYTSDAIISK